MQPAFPGMPQMPMGPGAPSDAGPDGGLLDPGMVGPDGMPADGGGPPPGDAMPGDGPEGVPPDGDGAGALPGDDGGDDDTPFPPKKDKKSGKGGNEKRSALFRGLEGQRLTEAQLVRHLAVRLSGADPRVMALLRSEGARRRTATTEERPYRTLPTGHQVSVGKLGDTWYGVIRHPQSAQVHYMHLGQGSDPDAEAERQLAASQARSFIHATVPQDTGAAGFPRDVPGEWYRGQGPGHAPSDWRPAQASRRTAAYGEERPGSPQAWAGVYDGLHGQPMSIRGGEHHVLVGHHPGTGHYYASIHPSAPEHQHMAHMVSLGAGGGDLRDRIDEAINTPQANHFIDSTRSRQDTPSRSASRGRRPFGRAAMRVDPDHGDMTEQELRQHMRGRHGFVDTPDDPDWVIDQTHRDEHADGNYDHAHPDLDREYGESIHLGDQDWLRQHGIGDDY